MESSIFDTQAANAENLLKGLELAYQNPGLKAVILRINSPGGSPVQADYMYSLIQDYRHQYPDIKIYAVCMDMCTSAAYYAAAAAEQIYANPASVVGSIGVLYDGFGFVKTMEKLGITRRLKTAGTEKAMLDPFSPLNPKQEVYLQNLLNEVHQQFINKVKEGRGNTLKIDNLTFSGLFWSGIEAKERGLIDGFASSGQIATNIIKYKEVIDYTYKPSVFERMAKHVGTAMANQLPYALGIYPQKVKI